MTGKRISLHQELRYLTDLAAAVVAAARVRPGEAIADQGPNTTGGTLIRPGGRACYPAFWIRDFTMSLGSGLITSTELEHALLLTARLQATRTWTTASGSVVPAGAIADHITFGGQPIYFPGTYNFEAQGQPWGYYPSLDDHFYFIEMAWQLVTVEDSTNILLADVDGIRLMDRLDLAFKVPQARGDTGLVWCDEAHRGVSFGFTDIVVHTGELLFCSLLRHRAARQMAVLHTRLGNDAAARHYRTTAQTIMRHIPRVFAHPSGLLRASTGKSGQPDVWGSAFALYIGALRGEPALRVSQALSRALTAGTIAWQGQIRHVPTDADFDERSAWEAVIGDRPKNRYQNGAYWGTPTGWVCFAVAQSNPAAARQLALDYVAALRRADFRLGEAYGAPYECVHPEGEYRQNPVYMTSVTCPLAAFRRLGWLGSSVYNESVGKRSNAWGIHQCQ